MLSGSQLKMKSVQRPRSCENNAFNVVVYCHYSTRLFTLFILAIVRVHLAAMGSHFPLAMWPWHSLLLLFKQPYTVHYCASVTHRIFCLIATNFIFFSLPPLEAHSCHQWHVLLFFSHDSCSIADNLPTIFACRRDAVLMHKQRWFKFIFTWYSLDNLDVIRINYL